MNLTLVNGLVVTNEDFEMRVHIRSQMEAAGMRAILEKCKEFHFPALDQQIQQYENSAEEDQKRLLERFDQDILRDMQDPYDVYRAIISSVEGTKAFAHFLSAMQHLS